MSKNSSKNQGTEKNYENVDEVLQELTLIRKLLIIMLAKLGSDSGEIGKAINVSPRTIRDWISFNGIESITEKTEQKEKRGGKLKTKKVSKIEVEEKTDQILNNVEGGE